MQERIQLRTDYLTELLADYLLVVTRNSEYHLKGDACVAVKNRNTGAFLVDHDMVGKTLKGCVVRTDPWLAVEQPVLGGALWFVKDGNAFLTSRILGVSLPSERDLAPTVVSPTVEERDPGTAQEIQWDWSPETRLAEAIEEVLPRTSDATDSRSFFAKDKARRSSMPAVTSEFHAPGHVLEELMTLPPMMEDLRQPRELRFSRDQLTMAPGQGEHVKLPSDDALTLVPNQDAGWRDRGQSATLMARTEPEWMKLFSSDDAEEAEQRTIVDGKPPVF